MAGIRVAVATREIARLSGDHHFILSQRAHVERLIGARAGRENIRARLK